MKGGPNEDLRVAGSLGDQEQDLVIRDAAERREREKRKRDELARQADQDSSDEDS